MLRPCCGHVAAMLRCVLRRSFSEVTSFALRTRQEKQEEAPIYGIYIRIAVYKVAAALCMLNAICDYSCGSKFLANEADT
jgi:hypothetical protein